MPSTQEGRHLLLDQISLYHSKTAQAHNAIITAIKVCKINVPTTREDASNQELFLQMLFSHCNSMVKRNN